MPQAREVKNRIDNIKDVRQITKAMNAIAMAKLTQMKQRLEVAGDYRERIEETLALLNVEDDEDDNGGDNLVNHPRDGRIGVMVFNSDRGLCGRYKEELNRATRDFVRSRDVPVTLVAGGEKSEIYFRDWKQLKKSWSNFYSEPDYEKAVVIARDILDKFTRGSFSSFWVIYMEFLTELNQQLRVEKVLPVEIPEGSDELDHKDYIVEPALREMRSRLLKFYFEEKIFWILLRTKASEHAIRRRAMRDATENADELIEDLTLKFNKARQQQITREIADIMGGSEALRQSGS